MIYIIKFCWSDLTLDKNKRKKLNEEGGWYCNTQSHIAIVWWHIYVRRDLTVYISTKQHVIIIVMQNSRGSSGLTQKDQLGEAYTTLPTSCLPYSYNITRIYISWAMAVPIKPNQGPEKLCLETGISITGIPFW